jgi:hypothetical protein
MRRKSKPRRSRKLKKTTPLIRKTQRAPQTTKELFARPRKFQELWSRIVQVPTEMRSKGMTLKQASTAFGVKSRDVLRLAPSAFKKDRKGRVSVRARDRLLRVLLIPSSMGLREVAVRDSREASLIGEYWSAVEKHLVRGDSSALKKLPRKTITDVRGKRTRLITNLDELNRQASAGVLSFESIYGRAE